MKTIKPKFLSRCPLFPSLIAAGSVLAFAVTAQATDKAASGTNLNDGASWDGAIAPIAGDIATWTATSLGAGLTISSDASWLGFDASAAVGDIDISGAATLTLGSSGISAHGTGSPGTVSIGNPVVLGADQSWTTVADSFIYANGAISGTSQLTLLGGGVVTLSESSDYSGGTVRQGLGTLALANSGALGSGGLTLQSIRTTAADTLSLSGGITVSNAITIDLETGREGILSETGDTLKWTGGAGNLWNTADNNFQLVAGGTPATYIDASPGDAVLFCDSALLGGTNIVLNSVFTPAGVTFDGAIDYSLTGTGGIAGGTGIVKNGTGTLTLGTDNSFTGKVTIATGGAVLVGYTNAFGSAAENTEVFNGGGLWFSGNVNVIDEPLRARGGGVGNNTGGMRNISGNNSWSGPITFTNSLRFSSDSGTRTVGELIANNRHVIFNGEGNLVINGPISPDSPCPLTSKAPASSHYWRIRTARGRLLPSASFHVGRT